MPDLEDLIRTTLDRQAPRPDPDPIVERVARRKRQVRLARRVQSATLAVVVVAGIAAGGFALARAFGVGGRRPSPAASNLPRPSIQHGFEYCGGNTASLGVDSQEGAAGTISTVWRVTNTTIRGCVSTGYPSIDVHGTSGWLSVRVLHGGYPNINERPTHVGLKPGESLFFISYWSDATTNSGPCEQFDRVRITLPGNSTPLEIASTGCIGPLQVEVGPVSASPPSG